MSGAGTAGSLEPEPVRPTSQDNRARAAGVSDDICRLRDRKRDNAIDASPRRKDVLRGWYAVERDFYLPLRNRIVEAFEGGWDPKAFDKTLADVTDPKKQTIYKRARAGLRKWAGVSGKRTYKWIKPKKSTWSATGST